MPTPYKYVFTVFTPTYNRANTLHRVYDSLTQQTFRDFEWLVVDDGSQDDTRALVEQWQQEADFPVTLIVQENMGKHFATNAGVRAAQGDLFLTLDSDDACIPTALERLNGIWNGIDPSVKDQFAGVTVLCQDQHGNLVGDTFPASPLDTDALALRYKYKATGEKWGFQRTDVMKEFPFPEDISKTYLPENIVWDRIGQKYKTRFVNEILRIYYVETGNLSLIHAPGKARRLAPGAVVVNRIQLNEHIKYLPAAPKDFIRAALVYCRASFHLRRSLAEQGKPLGNLPAKILWLIALIPAFCVYKLDCAKSAPSLAPAVQETGAA